ncbi:MAG: hypothetical protein CR986_08680 [Ignavibacteriae bacterium]|nr:MAG: hypothetical protein CR986_08680 [Ignavibacteriota bacterium]
MNKILSILLLLAIYACSSSIDTAEKKITKAELEQTNRNKEYAKQLFIDASLLDLEGKYAEAILNYQEALNLDPNAGIYYALSKDYLKLNKMLLSLNNIKEAVKLENNNTEYLTLLGTIYQVSGESDSSQVVFSKILEIDSTNVNALYNLAQSYQADKPNKALKTFKKILDLIGQDWNVLFKIAELNDRLGKVDETIKTVEELLELNPSDLQLKKLLIESYVKNKKYDEALNMLEDNLEIFPNDLILIELKGNAHIKKEEWAKGAKEYKKIIKSEAIPFQGKMRIVLSFYGEALNDSSVIPYAKDLLMEFDKDTSDWQINAFLGELNNKTGDDSLMLKYFDESIELAELNSDLRIRLGQLLFEKGDYENAVNYMESAVKRFPRNHVINFILGLSFAQLSKHKDAIPYLKKAVELNPNDLNTNLAYSFSLNQTDDDEEALIFLKRALRIDSRNTQAIGMMGMIYNDKKVYNKSDSLYSLAVSIDSTDILILNNFAYSLAQRGIELERALKMVQKAVNKEPENSSYLDTIGWVYFKMNNYEKAKEYIDKAIEIDSSNATLLEHLGDVYYKLNKKEKAKELWQEALKLDSEKDEIKEKIKKGLN